MILCRGKSSSCAGLGRSRLEDVTVRECLTVMPLSPDVSSSGVDGRVWLFRRPKQHVDDSRQFLGMSRLASFFLDEVVVPKTRNIKMPGVVPGMKRIIACISRPVLRSGAEAFESFMLLRNAVT